MIKSKKQMFTVIGAFVLVMLLTTVTYAFFNYTRTGVSNTIKTGRISFNTTQEGTLNLTNVFPVASNEVGNDYSIDTVKINITGDTTYNEGIEYLVTAENVNVKTSSGKKVPLTLNVAVTNDLGTEDTIEDQIEYFTDRGGNISYYKLLSESVLYEGQYLLVGYIAKGATGIDGTINIKAYLDRDKIAISDTYPSGNITHTEASEEILDYTNGTTADWVDGRVVLTTEEWNALQNSSLSFKVKVEANEGTWVPEPLTSYTQITRNVNTTTTINFGNVSSASNGQGLYILPGTENDTNPIYYYRGAVTDNNVIFGGFCWQMVRTTETGGIKMIYNGVAADNGTTCTNTTHADKILTSTSLFNTYYNSVADVGYMNNTRFTPSNAAGASGSIYGKDIEWDGNNYLVIEETANTASTNTTKDNYHHYSCGTSGTTTCSTVRYYYYNNYYITLSSGDLLADAIYKMTGNGDQATKTKNAGYNLNANNSTAKTAIDTWFRTNLTNEVDNTKTDYSVYLEDTVYCNDRSFKTIGSSDTYALSGWNPVGGNLSTYLYFGIHNRYFNSNWYSTTNVPTVKNSGVVPNIDCPNETDRFTVSSTNGNGALTYPVGLLTADEIIMAGVSGNSYTGNITYYLYSGATGGYYWSLSPYRFSDIYAYEFRVSSTGNLGSVLGANGLRPVVSLKPGTEFETGGEGTTVKPYVVKYE